LLFVCIYNLWYNISTGECPFSAVVPKEKPTMAVMTNTTNPTNMSKTIQAPARQKSHAIQRTARLVGLLILIMAVFAPFSMIYVPSTLIVPGDAATTAQNIMASEGLFRLGIASDAVVVLLELVIVVLLYVLLKPVSKTLSLVAAFSRLAMTVIQGVNLLPHFVVLLLLSGAGYLTVFAPDQLQALGLLFLNAHAEVVLIWGFFFGLHLLVLGYLVYKSGYIPRTVGVLLMIASLCYLTQSFGNILLPQYEGIFTSVGLLSTVEIALPLWLLIKGVNVAKWEKRVLEAASIEPMPQG
jgi:hypothetical protein